MAIPTGRTRSAQAAGPEALGAVRRLLAGLLGTPLLRLPVAGRAAGPREVMFFTSQLSLLLETGNPLPKALEIIGRQVASPRLGEIIAAMREDVESGRTLSEAMARHPDAFPPIYLSLIQAGEASGQMRLMLDRLASLYKKRNAFWGNLRRALAYPAFLGAFCCLVTLFMLLFIFPRFASLFEGIYDSLPVTTRWLMWLSEALRHYWYLFLAAAASVAATLYGLASGGAGRALLHRFELRAPVLSRLVVKVYLSELATTLGFLLHSNVPLLDALQVTRGAMRNAVLKGFVAGLSEQVEQGKGISAGFLEAPFVPDMVKEMMVTADETGKVDTVLLRLGEHYDEEVSRHLATVSSLVEPAALLVMGAVVGLLVMSLVIPITRLSRGVH